ncbi:hypothetical protein [uncultured Deinococcus sp.]|uniref:hypothetical protein n=1 Tax=uncultured Deinococcus sp. TaxID=158789 RepID=UPI00258EA5BA|nr:hypothetical protein [uncultured Deinococcus sp.]
MDLLTPLLPGVTPLFGLSLLLLAAYWLGQVWREARRGWRPGAAWWAVAGLLALLLAPVLDVPPLFGVGGGLLLVLEFWVPGYRRARTRPGWTWPLIAALLGAALGWSALVTGAGQTLPLVAGLTLLLCGLAGLLSSAAYPRTRRTELGFQARWSRSRVPEWPDLSVTLTPSGAQIRNVSRSELRLAGWSPRSVNGWLLVRDPQGQPLNTLRAGQTAFLPLAHHEGGVRVWYVPVRGPQDTLLFRADWTPVQSQGTRVLN